MQFTFDDHTLDTERRELLRGGAAIAVQPQVFDLLGLFAAEPGARRQQG